jgi:hypothetical protein
MDVRSVFYAHNSPLGGLGGVPCARGGLIHQIRAVLRGLISELPRRMGVKISLEGLVLCDISLNKLRGRRGAQRELPKAQKRL